MHRINKAWPEITQGMKEVGIIDMEIYVHGNILFMIMDINADHKDIVIEQLGVRPERILSEPLRKNTAPCIAYGTFIILNENPDAVIAVTPADHLIENEEEFRKTINAGFDFAQTNDALITLGIKPDKPETGYGYIQADKKNHVKEYDNLLKVKAFTEKPDINLANNLQPLKIFFCEPYSPWQRGLNENQNGLL